ncbi:putative serine protease K12H4.7 [Toxorhynchites rutilus septentrionalis]|uniref:putative serine protease K12H4.7 n=1 Tax=Toxorhynchites rutilus septentrionalis TaxID=329112 RepID=UPI0024786BDE|nr:putative serine protease K12H4.7 [Toxorhynchites rutilus septentrionalis]
MVNKLTLVGLLALFIVAAADQKQPEIAPILQHLLDTQSIPKPPQGYVPTEQRSTAHTFRTRVDHFNPQNRETFNFGYYSNDEYYQPGGPIFIYVGGNWPVSNFFIEHGHFHDLAARQHAWLFANEHRYYGQSIPTPNLSVQNLRFLTVEQSLVDLAEWINHLRRNVVRDDNARVVLLGTGYAGAIATWARQRYPHLVDGVWVSSGQLDARLNYKEYAVRVGELIRQHGSNECYGRIWRAFRTAENLIDAGLSSTVTELFKTCHPLNPESMLDAETLFFNVKEIVQEAILYLNANVSTPIFCEQLNNNTEATDLQTLAKWIENKYYYLQCLTFDFNSTVEVLLELENHYPENSIFGLRQRTYQLCTEFGWFRTAYADDQPFGYRVTMYFFQNICKAVFGEWLTSEVVVDGVHLTNMHFGGKNPRITNALFTSGGQEPARDIMITDYHQQGSRALVIPGYMASSDLGSVSGYDSPELLEAKHQIELYVDSWLYESIMPLK